LPIKGRIDMKLHGFRFAFAFTFLLASASGIFAQGLLSRAEARLLEEEFIKARAELGDSHASGAREDLGPVSLGTTATPGDVVRVGIHYSYTTTGTYSEFSTLNHPSVRIAHTEGLVNIVDRSNGTVIATMQVGQIYEVSFASATSQYTVSGPAGTFTVTGPVRFSPELATNQFRIESIRRTNTLVTGSPQVVPLYRGAVEVARGSATAADRVNLFNIIAVDPYVRGVVANESIASFHMDALKAQATAARGYALANIGNYIGRGYPFDIVDSSASQVYRGVISEHVRAVQATDETLGLVASYQSQIISALYSSSFGGYSDSNHWIFNLPVGQLPGTNVTPYLTGIFDGSMATPPDLSDPAVRQAFWTNTNTPNERDFAYDMCGYVSNRFARWRITIPASDIKARLVPPRIVVISGDTTGDITNVEVLQRMTGSNRISQIRVTLTTGAVEVRGWDNLRNVIGRTASTGTSPTAPCTGTAIAANFTLTNPALIELVMNPNNTVASVISTGGGWGHNVGMSQYGAHGRGMAGQNFLQILKAYYQGVDIGTAPVALDSATGPFTQQFYAPTASGRLVVRATPQLKGFKLVINDVPVGIRIPPIQAGYYVADISQYIVPGVNTIVYNAVGRTAGARANVNID
jgi:peptidoglycan hydrolase-like amidase